MKVTDYIYRVVSRLWFWLAARNTLGYGIHSPYLYYIVRFLFYDDNTYYCFTSIERERDRLLRATKTLDVTDYGTGVTGKRSVKDIARTSLASRKEAQLLFRLVNFLQPRCSVELGTSLGITASYIASASSKICLTTIEGSENIAAEAQKVFEKLRLKNIRQVVGNIDVCLPQFLKEADVVDFAFLDANHTEKATLRYFMQLLPHCGQKTVLVLDDIHYSVGMNNAWRAICRLPEVTAAMDLWDLGIVFFNKQLEKRIYKIRI